MGGALLLMGLVFALLASARSAPSAPRVIVEAPQVELPAAAMPAAVHVPQPIRAMAASATVAEAPATFGPVRVRTAPPRYQRGHARTHASLTREEVGSGLRAVAAAVGRCDAGSGFANVDVVIRGSGKVASASLFGYDRKDPAVRCVLREVRKARFPEFDGKPVSASYPFRL